MEKGLLEKTGKSLEEWIKVVKASKIEKHGEIVKFLKSDHGFTHGYANFVSLKSREADAASFNPEDLVNAQYTKGKEHLKAVYDLLIEKINTLGSDIEIVPKKANVSVRRKRQFALIQPSTKARIDLGLKLNDSETDERLKGSGSFGSMCSNKIEIFGAEEVDDELLKYLRRAYNDAG
ncbi:DUF4287 domain-containing protein [Leptobacterium flavescens]|uniref:DUF4287 domain-containing protein n=1 Tax=Leptobacterium flavescens TaxID=472055 RepID=A0A6P0UL20_9FLAO|nr:DUF5655 domain-containing protein [Leptobacterium flavescens]NER13667.1 DUF4287 domain-containing protein [Leptobacterium flavescens]